MRKLGKTIKNYDWLKVGLRINDPRCHKVTKLQSYVLFELK